MPSIAHFFNLIRWKNICIITITQVLVYLFLNESLCINTIMSASLMLVCLSTILIEAAGYMINDYSDGRIDAVNKPASLIVGRFISRRAVLAMYIAFNFIAIVISLLVSYKFALLNIVISFILWQ